MGEAPARQRPTAESRLLSIRFLADVNLDFSIVQGVRHREPSVDFKSAKDAGLDGLSDDEVLEVAATEGRILVSHDKNTMPLHFQTRLRSGRPSPGVLLALPRSSVGEVIESILIIWSASSEDDWGNQIHYLPSLNRHGFR